MKLIPTFYAEAQQDFDGNCSVQVYSVQASIPKDPALLWNAEFIQAEELSKQPSSVDNCLRDNRYVPFLQNMHILVYMHLVLSFGCTQASLVHGNAFFVK
jgi:hypothetical protein